MRREVRGTRFPGSGPGHPQLDGGSFGSGGQARIRTPSSPRRIRTARRPTAAGRRGPANPTRRPAASTAPRAVLRTSRRPPAGRLHPVHRQHTNRSDRWKTPVGELKTVRVDLPAGLTVNPQATEQCRPDGLRSRPRLPARPTRRSAKSFVTASVLGVPTPGAGPADRLQHRTAARRAGPLRLQPRRQQRLPAGRRRLGERLPRGLHDRRPRTALRQRLNCFPDEAAWCSKTASSSTDLRRDGTFITTPTTCLGEASPPRHSSTSTRPTCWPARSLKRPNPDYDFPPTPRRRSSRGSRPGTSPKDCGTIPFEPSIAVDPNTAADRLSRRRDGRRRACRRSKAAANQSDLAGALRPGDAAGGHGPQPLGRQRPRGLHRRAVRQGQRGTRSPVRRRRRSARSKSTRRRFPTAR